MWLIDKNCIEDIALFRKIVTGEAMTSEVKAGMEKLKAGSRTPIYSVDGNKATINVVGVLTKEPSYMMRYFGMANTSYAELTEAIDEIEANDEIKESYNFIDSPGGQVDGFYPMLDKVKSMTKNKGSVAGSLIASAAYGYGAAAGKITASHYSTRAGSIGVVVDFYDDDELVSITSDGAENKRPDHKTEEGMSEIKRELNDMAGLFMRHIGEARGVSNEEILESYGNGSVFLAEEAKKRGMIDAISTKWVKKSDKNVNKTAQTNEKDLNLQSNYTQKGRNVMTFEEFKASQPEFVEKIQADAVKGLKDNIKAHAVLAEISGDKELALEGILGFEEPTAELKAKHETASWKKETKEEFQTDAEKQAAAAALASGDGKSEKTPEEKVVDDVFATLNAKRKGTVA